MDGDTRVPMQEKNIKTKGVEPVSEADRHLWACVRHLFGGSKTYESSWNGDY